MGRNYMLKIKSENQQLASLASHEKMLANERLRQVLDPEKPSIGILLDGEVLHGECSW